VAADHKRSMFTPRKDPCVLTPRSKSRAVIRWPASESSWGIQCRMDYELGEEGSVDIAFSATPTVDQFPLGFVTFMWAGYMGCARDRRIYFLGKDGDREGWMAFGEDIPDGFEKGTVSAAGVPNLSFEEGAQILNLVEHPAKHFTEPFYYGLLDGDHDLATTDDTLAYIVMFDQRNPIRFALWNFIVDASGKPDTHSPAWDWQYVIREPKVGKTYRYRMRVLIKPFQGPEDVLREYRQWAKRVK